MAEARGIPFLPLLTAEDLGFGFGSVRYPAPVGAITFDYWNTIVRANGDQGPLTASRPCRRIYAAAGHVGRRRGRPARCSGRCGTCTKRPGLRNEQYTGAPHAGRRRHRPRRPCPSTEERCGPRLVEAFVTAGERSGFDLCDGVDVLLPALRERGIALGIVCDVGFTPSTGLRRLLAGFGLLEHFSGWSCSDDVGWYKPTPEIFEHALDYLAAAPDAVAHVGDLRSTDVAGPGRWG